MRLGNDSTHSESALNSLISLRDADKEIGFFRGEHGQISTDKRFPIIEFIHPEHEVVVLGRVGDLFYVCFLSYLEPLFKREIADELSWRYEIVKSANASIGPEHEMVVGGELYMCLMVNSREILQQISIGP